MDLQRRVQDRMRSWLPYNSKVLIAVSGGPDSVALTHLFKGLPYRTLLGHVDHRLRKSSGRDARFVADLAAKWGIPLQTARVAVRAHASAHGQGIEEAARKLRYQALIRMARQARCAAVITGHTADDQSETVLMNFLRGAGPGGLAGIPLSRDLAPGLRVLRPLLDVPRAEILAYLKRYKVGSRKDPSNQSRLFTRNRIRLELLPLLEKDFPGLKRRLAQVGELFREDQALWAPRILREINKTARQDSKKITIDLAQLLGYHKALGRRILRHFLTGISFQELERVFQLALSPAGAPSVQLSGGVRVERKGKALIILRGMHE